MKFTINANRYRINSIFGDPQQLWQMPNPGDVPVVDIVRAINRNDKVESASGTDQAQRRMDHRTSSLRNANFSAIERLR